MTQPDRQTCCPPFDPAPWDEKTLAWEGRRFVRDRVRCFLHVPVNFAAVMKRSVALIEAAGALPEEMIVLADHNSLWGADVFIGVTKDVPGARMATLSGTFVSKVFEGPYKDSSKWMRQMVEYVAAQGRSPKHLYSYYTTCPKCAKKYGKNYVVLLAEV